jgi:4-hydroxy-tetrahydrodipicolinate synthase
MPVILQNARIGFPLSANTLVALVERVPEIEYVKQETNPPTHGISDVIRVLGDRVRGVFGGVGGIYLINELERGAAGTMPSPAFVDAIAVAYRGYRAGQPDIAQDQLDRFGTLFTRELLYNAVLIKEVLRRRGVLRSAAVRIASPILDEVDLAELNHLLARAGIRAAA